MIKSSNGIQREVKVIGQKLGAVINLRYFGAVVSDNGSATDILSSIVQSIAGPGCSKHR